MRTHLSWFFTGLFFFALLGFLPALCLAEVAVKKYADLEYAKVGEHSLLLDLYLPDGEFSESLPILVWVHGGGWRAGSKKLGEQRVAAVIDHGYALASVSYRFSQQAVYPAQIHDCKAAIRWLRAHADEYHLDGERIGAWGASAGGHLVALLATTGDVPELEGTHCHLDQSSRVQCVCDWFGPTDLPHYDDHWQGPSKPSTNPQSLLSLLLGGTIAENAELAALASPITFVSADDAPMLIVHGDRDPLVPLKQSEVFRDSLQAATLPVELITLEGAGHGGKEFSSPVVVNRIWQFFADHLQDVE